MYDEWYNEDLKRLRLVYAGRSLIYLRKEDKQMYKKVSTNLNFVDREKKIEEFWKENKILEAVL